MLLPWSENVFFSFHFPFACFSLYIHAKSDYFHATCLSLLKINNWKQHYSYFFTSINMRVYILSFVVIGIHMVIHRSTNVEHSTLLLKNVVHNIVVQLCICLGQILPSTTGSYLVCHLKAAPSVTRLAYVLYTNASNVKSCLAQLSLFIGEIKVPLNQKICFASCYIMERTCTCKDYFDLSTRKLYPGMQLTRVWYGNLKNHILWMDFTEVGNILHPPHKLHMCI